MISRVGETSVRILRSQPRFRCHFSSSTASLKPVELSFDHHPSPSGGRCGPLVVLHGLYGSKQNWRTMAKRMAHRCGTDVYTLDLRNHGDSPATPGEVSYSDYASDVTEFIDTRSLKDVTLIGHSMGGKVAMALALQPHSSLARLISVDMAPAVGPISPEFASYVEAMKAVDAARPKTKKEADAILARAEPDLAVRQFLLTNLKSSPGDPSTYRIRLPLETLADQLSRNAIGSFPYAPGSRSWDGPTLFVKGSRSKYINRKSIAPAEGFFPNHAVQTLEAGHWVHAEKPNEFIELVANFVQGKDLRQS